MHSVNHGVIGGLISMVTLQSQNMPDMSDAIKALIAIAVGLCGTFLSYYLNKWLVKKNTPPK